MKKIIRLLAFVFVISPVNAWVFGFDILHEDDNFVIGGARGNHMWISSAYILKVDSQGNKIWEWVDKKKDCTTHIWNILDAGDSYILGGVILCENKDGWIAKVSKNGSILWEKVYGFEGWGDSATTITMEGKNVVAALTIAPCDEKGERKCINEDIWLIKLDENGNEIWRKTIDYKDYDSPKKIRKVSDGYIMVTLSGDFNASIGYNYSDIVVYKLDENGEIVWRKIFTFKNESYSFEIEEIQGNYFLVGTSWDVNLHANVTPQQVRSHAFVLELGKNGSLIWQREIRVGQVTSGWSIVEASDGLVVAGTGGNLQNNHPEKFVWLAKIKNGEYTYYTYVDDFRFETFALGIAKILKLREGYLLMSNACNGECIWLLRVDESGNILWKKTYYYIKSSKHTSTLNLSALDILVTLLVLAFFVVLRYYRRR